MNTPEPDSLDRLSHSELIGLVRELLGEVKRVGAENEKLNGSLAKLKLEHQGVKDELARLKHLHRVRRKSPPAWISRRIGAA